MRNYPFRAGNILLGVGVGLALMASASTNDVKASAVDDMQPTEQVALNVRALQSDMMVGALTCDMRAAYNATVSRFSGELVRHGRHLRAYFERAYGTSGPRELDRVVTRLANRSSAYALDRGNDYCEATQRLFTDLLALPTDELAQYAAERAGAAQIDQAALAPQR